MDQSTHVTQNQVDVISQYVSTRLKRICARGAKGKVLTAAEIERAKVMNEWMKKKRVDVEITC